MAGFFDQLLANPRWMTVLYFVAYSLILYALSVFVGPWASLSFIALTIAAEKYFAKTKPHRQNYGGDTLGNANVNDVKAPEREEERDGPPPPPKLRDEVHRRVATAATTTTTVSPPLLSSATPPKYEFADVVADDDDSDDDSGAATLDDIGAHACIGFGEARAGLPLAPRKSSEPMDEDHPEFLEDLRGQPRKVGLRNGRQLLEAGNTSTRRARMREVMDRKVGYAAPNERLARYHQRQLDMAIAIRTNTQR